MARQRHLPNAPITEALIDIQVTPREGMTYARLEAALEPMDFGYHVRAPIAQNVFGFKIGGEDGQRGMSSDCSQIGLRLHSEDEKYVAQCRIEGCTLSRLAPYEDWSKLVGEARRVWEIYVGRVDPQRVKRVATRFINSLHLPLQQGDSYQTYLRKLADVPEELPQALASFFQRFEMVDVGTGSHVILTSALQPTKADGRTPVILDIDAFVPKGMTPLDEQLWQALDGLRELKNRTFFGAITEEAARLYE